MTCICLCVCVCLLKPMLAYGCSVSNTVRKVLLRKMNTHKDNERDFVWVHYVCMCISVYVVMAIVQVMNDPGGWVEESVYKTPQPAFPLFYHPPSFHLYSPPLARISFVFSPLRLPSLFCLCFFVSSISLPFLTNLISVCAASGQSSGGKQMSAILFYGTATSKFPSVWNN